MPERREGARNRSKNKNEVLQWKQGKKKKKESVGLYDCALEGRASHQSHTAC